MIRDKHYLKLSHLAYDRDLSAECCGKNLREIGAEITLLCGVDLSDMEEWRLLVIRDERVTGFYGIAVQHMPTDTTVIAYRGTEWRLQEPGDLIAGLSLITPFNSLIDCQLEQAMAFHDEVMAQGGGNTIHLTGHSLGGALAQKVALGRQCKTVSFNALGVLQVASMIEKFRNLRGVYEELILNYVESGDIFVGNNPLFPHPGKVVHLDSFAGSTPSDDCVLLDLVQFKYHGLSNFYNDLDQDGNIAGSRIDSNLDYTTQLLVRLKDGIAEIRQRLRAGGVWDRTIQLGGTGEIVLAEQSA